MAEVTTAAGGKITGLLALTFETAVSLPKDVPVQVDGDYHVKRADGTKISVGNVDMPPVKRVGGAYPVQNVPGVVTVGARGYEVRTMRAGGAITAGDGVKVDVNGLLLGGAASSDAGFIGVALTGAAGLYSTLDVLVQ